MSSSFCTEHGPRDWFELHEDWFYVDHLIQEADEGSPPKLLKKSTMTVVVVYEFTRDSGTTAFFKTNRGSTDALGVLCQWEQDFKGRSFEVLYDEGAQGDKPDDKLIARLTMSEEDTAKNPLALDDLCTSHGLVRKVVS